MTSQAAGQQPAPQRGLLVIYSALMLALLLAALDQTIVATALPKVVSDLGGLSSYSWVFTAYVLAATVSVPRRPSSKSEATHTTGATAAQPSRRSAAGRREKARSCDTAVHGVQKEEATTCGSDTIRSSSSRA